MKISPPDKFLYEYSVIRYVPRIDREEFLNIGLVMMCKRQKWLKGKVSLNFDKLRCLDPKVNIDNLKRQTHYLEREDVPCPDLPVEEKYRWLSSVKSAMIQSSPSHPGIIIPENPEEEADYILELEFERLFNDLVI